MWGMMITTNNHDCTYYYLISGDSATATIVANAASCTKTRTLCAASNLRTSTSRSLSSISPCALSFASRRSKRGMIAPRTMTKHVHRSTKSVSPAARIHAARVAFCSHVNAAVVDDMIDPIPKGTMKLRPVVHQRMRCDRLRCGSTAGMSTMETNTSAPANIPFAMTAHRGVANATTSRMIADVVSRFCMSTGTAMDATTMGSRMTIFVKVVFRFILPGVTTADGDGDGGGGIIVIRMCTTMTKTGNGAGQVEKREGVCSYVTPLLKILKKIHQGPLGRLSKN
mmetsp:Transcript_9848/g.24942  ORF Transcript_9848/g.24942 Transcript_9848/m.24942 type:complete len:283 (-) Transcript_9848:110-958(-)